MNADLAEKVMATDSSSDRPARVDRVWSVQDLQILHEIQKPIAVIVPEGNKLSRTSSEDVSSCVLFHNTECQRRFGTPRALLDRSDVLSSMTESAHKQQQDWVSTSLQGNKVNNLELNIHALLGPYFGGIAPEGPELNVRIESKSLRVRTSTGQGRTAIMSIADMGASHSILRMTAMNQRDPIHSFLFDRAGMLLDANAAAMHSCKSTAQASGETLGQRLTLKDLFETGVYPGGNTEAQAVYQEAVQAIFGLCVNCHRHMQPHTSEKDGKFKWAMIEMWPMQDPVTASPAVLVKRYSITQHKELEHQLSLRHGVLQRQKRDLEEVSVAMQEEKAKLQQEADNLAQQLQAVLSDKFVPRTGFDAETPIDKTLGYLESVIGGLTPSLQDAMELHHILSRSGTNLRQPVDLEEQLLQDRCMGSDVGESMLQMLQGNPSRSSRSLEVPAAAGTPPAPWCSVTPYLATPGKSDAETDSKPQAGTDAFVPAALIPNVERLLQKAESSWQFDIFEFADATPGTTLSLLTFHLMKQAGVVRTLSIDEGKLCFYLKKVEKGYDPEHPYHNSTHVASVVQMTHMLLCHGGIMKSKAMTAAHHLASYWAAAVHDYEHGGLNNDFLIKTAHPLAITYSDQSPLEHHHVAAATKVFLEPECQYLNASYMSAEDIMLARSCAVQQILGTDMKKHFDILSRFQAAFKRPLLSGGSSPRNSLEGRGALDWDGVKAEDKTLVHQMVTKCADIGHLAARFATHKRWSLLLEEEFFRQGDQERALGLIISPLMDRQHKGGMTRSQMGFFSIVGLPLFKAMTELFEDARPMLDAALANYRHWETMAKAQFPKEAK